MVRCKIKFENNSRKVYSAGELLKGSVELHLDNPKRIRAFWLIIYGAAKCHWTDETKTSFYTNQRSRKRTHYEGKDVYTIQKTFLFGSEGSSEPIEIASGTYKYEFSCKLPAQLPASFRGSHGSINYEIEAVMDIPWAFDKDFKLNFRVVRDEDLNKRPDLQIPIKSEEIRRFCCLFCKSKPLIMTVTLPFSGYSQGQKISIIINFVNKSDVNVISTEISFKRVVRYASQSPHHKLKYEVEKMVSVNAAGVRKLQSVIIEKSLTLPSILTATNARFCRAVQLYYELKIEARTEGFNGNVEMKIPIFIGTTPISLPSTASMNSPAAHQPLTPHANTTESNNLSTLKPIESQHDLPPSYDEVVKPDNYQVPSSDVK